MCIDRGVIVERRCSNCRSGRIGKCECIRNLSPTLIRKKGDDFIFPFADGITKLLGRGCEFRELTSRQEETVRSENLRGELQGEPQTSILTRRRIDRDICETATLARHRTMLAAEEMYVWHTSCSSRMATLCSMSWHRLWLAQLKQLSNVRLGTHHEIWRWLCMVMISSLLEMVGCHRN